MPSAKHANLRVFASSSSAHWITFSYVSIRQHTSAYLGSSSSSAHWITFSYVSIRPYTSAYVRICQHTSEILVISALDHSHIRQHTSALDHLLYKSVALKWLVEEVRVATHCSDSIRQHTLAYVSIGQRTSAHVQRLVEEVRVAAHCSDSIRQHTSAYVSIRTEARRRSQSSARLEMPSASVFVLLCW